MKTASMLQDLQFDANKVSIKVMLETDFTKEIRIAFNEGQEMKKHQTNFPIVIQVFEGEIDFGVNDERILLKTGDIVALEGSVPHDLKAMQKSIVRLTLAKTDDVNRIQKIIS